VERRSYKDARIAAFQLVGIGDERTAIHSIRQSASWKIRSAAALRLRRSVDVSSPGSASSTARSIARRVEENRVEREDQRFLCRFVPRFLKCLAL
jgi:hypothetical protein